MYKWDCRVFSPQSVKQKCCSQWTFIHLWWDSNWHNHMGKPVTSLKAEHSPILWPINSTCRCAPEKCIQKNAYIDSPRDMPKKCHYVIAKTKKLLKCPSIIEQVNTLWHSHTAMNMSKLQPNITMYRKFDIEQKKPDQKRKQKILMIPL